MDAQIRPEDPVIIGAGLAGMLTALHLAPRRCHLVFPAALNVGRGRSNIGPTPPNTAPASSLAQGGIAAAISSSDSPAAHAADTLRAGAGLCDRAVVERVTAAAPEVIATLQKFGARFDTEPDGSLRLGLEGGHGARRIVHAADRTGAEIMRALTAAVLNSDHISLWPQTTVRAVHQRSGTITALTFEGAGRTQTLPATRVVLATGGLGGLFRHTTNPPGALGSGIALAARAGARLRDLEFVQFHPTALARGTHQLPLISEAVRGEGARLVTSDGVPILDDALATRDIVARAVWRASSAGRDVFLTTPEVVGGFSNRFPTIAAHCRQVGIDPDDEPVPVRVAAHYSMGGIAVDAAGRSSLEGLWAVGEVAGTGLHGANRLASNSLLEAAAYARWVAQDIESQFAGSAAGWNRGAAASANFTAGPASTESTELPLSQIQEIVTGALGVEREIRTLDAAIMRLKPHAAHSDAALVALLLTRAARGRSQSVGAHSIGAHGSGPHEVGARSRRDADVLESPDSIAQDPDLNAEKEAHKDALAAAN